MDIMETWAPSSKPACTIMDTWKVVRPSHGQRIIYYSDILGTYLINQPYVIEPDALPFRLVFRQKAVPSPLSSLPPTSLAPSR